MRTVEKEIKFNMARDVYFFSNGLYSDWHRKYDGIAYIDVDSVECCQYCFEPLAIIETCYDKNQKWKATTLSKIIAERLNIPCFLVFYKESTPGSLTLGSSVYAALRQSLDL